MASKPTTLVSKDVTAIFNTVHGMITARNIDEDIWIYVTILVIENIVESERIWGTDITLSSDEKNIVTDLVTDLRDKIEAGDVSFTLASVDAFLEKKFVADMSMNDVYHEVMSANTVRRSSKIIARRIIAPVKRDLLASESDDLKAELVGVVTRVLRDHEISLDAKTRRDVIMMVRSTLDEEKFFIYASKSAEVGKRIERLLSQRKTMSMPEIIVAGMEIVKPERWRGYDKKQVVKNTLLKVIPFLGETVGSIVESSYSSGVIDEMIDTFVKVGKSDIFRKQAKKALSCCMAQPKVDM